MTMEDYMVAKLVDSKGRIVLDKSYAGATMLVDQRADGTIVLRPAVTVPANEAWLWKNKKALAMVQRGLKEARQGRFVKPPDLAAGEKLAARIKD
jgi:predicted transcriptional regulator